MQQLFPTPYPQLNHVLQDLVASVRTVLNANFVATYLQGSFALGDFDLHSDVDFIVVIADELAEAEVHGLQEVHQRIYDLDIPWAQHLEGSYFPRKVLRDTASSNKLLWYLDHGSNSLIQSTHCNTALVRSVIREHGIILAGPAPALLVDPISVETLRRHILATIHDWGQEILSDPAPYNNRFYQGFITLNYCRMLHDLHRGRPGSKLAGATWAKANLDPCWQGLIDRAWNGRPDPAVSSRQRADPHDFIATLAFITYCRNQTTLSDA